MQNVLISYNDADYFIICLKCVCVMLVMSVAAFGFCEYKEPESTLRSLRLLHDLQIGDKSLLVKVDAKTKAQLDEWKAKKKTANGVYNHVGLFGAMFCVTILNLITSVTTGINLMALNFTVILITFQIFCICERN